MVGIISGRRAQTILRQLPSNVSTSSTGTRNEYWQLLLIEMEGCCMSIRSSDAAIDEIVASCNGDLRGAVRALLLINEHLEAELAQLYATAAHNGLAERRNNALH
jgi:hypothetical protein